MRAVIRGLCWTISVIDTANKGLAADCLIRILVCFIGTPTNKARTDFVIVIIVSQSKGAHGEDCHNDAKHRKNRNESLFYVYLQIIATQATVLYYYYYYLSSFFCSPAHPKRVASLELAVILKILSAGQKNRCFPLDKSLDARYNNDAKQRRLPAPPHLPPMAKRSTRIFPGGSGCLCGCSRHPLLLYFMEVFSIAKLTHQLNEEIQDKEIRVIGADGAQLGIMTSEAALDLAAEQDLDLVKISPTANPPVCKIMDYGKFRFDQMKKDKENRKNQRVVEIKEIRMSPGIDTNDLNTKMKNACKFLKEGNRVKVSVRFRGREMAHTNIGEELLNQFAEGCSEFANMEKNPKLEGRFMFMFLSPKAENKK